MVVRIHGGAVGRRHAGRPDASLPPVATSVFLLASGILAAYLAGLGPMQLALAATVLTMALGVPLLRVVRTLEVGRYGIEAELYSGTRRYLKFYEIDSVTVGCHAGIPGRICIEDVYGRRMYLDGGLSNLERVLAGRAGG